MENFTLSLSTAESRRQREAHRLLIGAPVFLSRRSPPGPEDLRISWGENCGAELKIW
jgi:hypothetical protein